jgi:hypothetical protein
LAHTGTRFDRTRAELADRLATRREEIEQAVLARVHGIADPSGIPDSSYAEGLRAAVSAGLDYGLAAITRGDDRAPPIPVVLLAQARLAARSGVSLDTVLRRYFAGYALLGDFLIEEAAQTDVEGRDLQRVQAVMFDRLLAAVGDEYAREGDTRASTAEQHRADRVRRLLAGELLDTTGLAYDFSGFHTGVVGVGAGAAEATRELAASLDRRVLLIDGGEGALWAWLGGRRQLDPVELQSCIASSRPPRISLAIGEPGHGVAGWRLTHYQAKAALPIAARNGEEVIHYADVALLAAVLQDDLLVASLRQLYLEPIERGRDRGQSLRETLRAYFAAAGNVSSAAAALGVKRHTVSSRLRTIEHATGRPVQACAIEMDLALRLNDLDDPDLLGAGFSTADQP